MAELFTAATGQSIDTLLGDMNGSRPYSGGRAPAMDPGGRAASIRADHASQRTAAPDRFARNSPIWRSWSLETCREAADAMATSRGYDSALNGTLHRVAECTARIPSSIPVTIVFGDTDTILPPHTSQSRRYLPAHARWLEWERCGHAIQLDHPERVVALLKEMAN